MLPSRKLKNSIICRNRKWTAAAPSSPLWKAAPNTVPSAWCPTPAVKEVSRPLADVLKEVQALARQGVREVNLLGQNVNAYRGATKDGDIADLAELITLVAGYRRHRPHPFHHLTPAGIQRQFNPGVRRSTGAGQPPASCRSRAVPTAFWPP